MINVSIVGSTGYAGIELVRLLNSHPKVSIAHLVSHSHSGEPIAKLYPNFKGIDDTICMSLNINTIVRESDLVFTSLPHGTSDDIVHFFHSEGIKVVDLSADFRYKDISTYEKWYNRTHKNPHLIEESVYGLPEFYREDIKNASIIGNPGCYSTCAILAIVPLIYSQVLKLDSIIIDAKSGATGAGKTPSKGLHFCELSESIRAYSIAAHRHTSEIEEVLSLFAKEEIKLSFTPHLMPIKRGILCTIYADLKDSYPSDYIYDIYMDLYANEPFIQIYEDDQLPEPKFVNGSNSCHIGFKIDERLNRIVIVSTIDNLIKGASGQAIQNMNILFGLKESMGLNAPAWYL